MTSLSETSTRLSTKQSLKKKVLEHKRKWLIAKTHRLKKSYQRAVATFQQKLYTILQPIISEAFDVLTKCEEDEFLEKLYNIGTDLEKCDHQLYEINLMHCDEICFDFSDDETDDDVSGKCLLASSSSSIDNSNCAFEPLTLLDFFFTDDQQPQLQKKVKPDVKAHDVSSNSLHTSPCDEVQMNSVSCQCNLLSPKRLDSKYCQTVDVGDRTVTSECQTDNLAYKLKADAVQTDISFSNDATLTLLSDAEHCQSKDAHNCNETTPNVALSVGSSCNEDVTLETNTDGFETVEVVKDASEVSSVVDDVFHPAVNNAATSKSFAPTVLQTEEPLCQLAAFEEYAAGLHEIETDSTACEETYSSDDIDLLLVNDIEKGQRTCVFISHVINPSLFSVQPKGCEEQLIELQTHINTVYANEKSNRYAFRKPPSIGTLCLAIFEDDKLWYRAKIINKLSPTEFEVMYIDYGNCNIVHIKNLLKIDDLTLANVPQLSIPCSLCGVKPCCEDGTSTWSDSAVSWFRQQVLNKLFDVLFVTSYDQQQCSTYSTHLLCHENAANQQSIVATVSIANRMVGMGYASFFTQTPALTQTKETHEVNQEFQPIDEEVLMVGKGDETSLQSDIENNKSSCVDKGVDWTKLYQDQLSKLNTSNAVSGSLNLDSSSKASCLHDEDSRSLDDVGFEDIQPSDVQQQLPPCSQWDPMKEDFVSERNKYNINVDDACVAVEKIDPSKTEICKYFARGNCWKGKNCNWLHVSNPDVLYRVQVLSGHNLKEVELDVNENIIIKILSTPKNDDFYVHILKRDKIVAGYNNATAKVEELSRDLKKYYAKVGTKQSIDNEICIGEVHVVEHQQAYCRVTVLDISKPTRIQVLLVDYGNTKWISPKQLLPMSEMFMSIPMQALLCTYDKTTSKVEPVKDCCYFANVGDCLGPADSPTLLTLLGSY